MSGSTLPKGKIASLHAVVSRGVKKKQIAVWKQKRRGLTFASCRATSREWRPQKLEAYKGRGGTQPGTTLQRITEALSVDASYSLTLPISDYAHPERHRGLFVTTIEDDFLKEYGEEHAW